LAAGSKTMYANAQSAAVIVVFHVCVPVPVTTLFCDPTRIDVADVPVLPISVYRVAHEPFVVSESPVRVAVDSTANA